MIYTDKIHIVSDGDVWDLHVFARLIGLHICWFDGNPRHPHYDFPKRSSGGKNREQLQRAAVDAGAVVVTSRELVEIIKKKS